MKDGNAALLCVGIGVSCFLWGRATSGSTPPSTPPDYVRCADVEFKTMDERYACAGAGSSEGRVSRAWLTAHKTWLVDPEAVL